jgi:hypothetical protein
MGSWANRMSGVPVGLRVMDIDESDPVEIAKKTSLIRRDIDDIKTTLEKSAEKEEENGKGY